MSSMHDVLAALDAAVQAVGGEQFIPFLAFPPEVRRVIYTTNSIESLTYQMRKVIKTRGQFPKDAAVVKLLWLAICNIEVRRAAGRAKERNQVATRTAVRRQAKAESHPRNNAGRPGSGAGAFPITGRSAPLRFTSSASSCKSGVGWLPISPVG
jgi:hypothetical protein